MKRIIICVVKRGKYMKKAFLLFVLMGLIIVSAVNAQDYMPGVVEPTQWGFDYSLEFMANTYAPNTTNLPYFIIAFKSCAMLSPKIALGDYWYIKPGIGLAVPIQGIPLIDIPLECSISKELSVFEVGAMVRYVNSVFFKMGDKLEELYFNNIEYGVSVTLANFSLTLKGSSAFIPNTLWPDGYWLAFSYRDTSFFEMLNNR